jgi:hypothetical protein
MTGNSQVKVTQRFIQGLTECPAKPPFCTRQAVLALLQRLTDGRPPHNRYPALAEEDNIMTASVGVGQQARILVYYVDIDHATHQQVCIFFWLCFMCCCLLAF